MRFEEFMCPEAVQLQLDGAEKTAVVQQLVNGLVDCGALPADIERDVVRAILRREELGTTAIGPGIAIPHVKHPRINRLIGTVGIHPQGVDFSSLDGAPTHLFMVLLSPADQPGMHLRAMEHCARRLKNPSFCRQLQSSTTSDELWATLHESDLAPLHY